PSTIEAAGAASTTPDEDTMMKTPTLRTILGLAVLTTFVGAASAQATRAEVRAAYAEALRTGDVMAPGETGLNLNRLSPQRSPHEAAAPGRARSEVKAELAQAVRDGDVIAAGEIGLTQ